MLYQLTLEPCWTSPRNGGEPDSGPDSDHPSLAIPTVVPETPQLSEVEPTENLFSAGPDAEVSGGLPIRSKPLSGCLAYLKKYYSSKRISEKASDLILSSSPILYKLVIQKPKREHVLELSLESNLIPWMKQVPYLLQTNSVQN